MNEPKPRAWMRRWAFDGVKPGKERNDKGRLVWPARFKFLPVTINQIFPDDVPLYAPAAGVSEAGDLSWDQRERTINAGAPLPTPAHSKSEYKRRVAQGDPNVLPPRGVRVLRSCPATRPECPHTCTKQDCDALAAAVKGLDHG
jgi:hypothetical protein